MLAEALGSEDLLAVAAGSKRISNILDKASDAQATVDTALFAVDAESEMWRHFESAQAQVSTSLTNGRFADALAALAKLRASIDGYFDQVMVNAEDPALKAIDWPL